MKTFTKGNIRSMTQVEYNSFVAKVLFEIVTDLTKENIIKSSYLNQLQVIYEHMTGEETKNEKT